MTPTRSTPRARNPRHRDRRFWPFSTRWTLELSDMTYLVVIAVTAAFLTGFLSLHLMMPGAAFASPDATFGTRLAEVRALHDAAFPAT